MSNKRRQRIYAACIGCIMLVFGCGTTSAFAQTPPGALYVPLIGVTSVPDPFALPEGAGEITYNYAVKSFIAEAPLTGVQVTDNTCAPVEYITGDDNGNAVLDETETWRYTCTTTVSKTTQSVATAVGTFHDVTATHKAYTTVVVGVNDPAPLVSIVHITKIAYPLSLPSEGGKITFTYRVNNPGIVPLSQVVVTDDGCGAMSGKLGDTNGNNLLDTHEVWIYTCTMNLTQTATNTVHVSAFANGLEAVDNATLTIEVDAPVAIIPDFPDVGPPDADANELVWKILLGALAVLLLLFVMTRIGGLINRKIEPPRAFIPLLALLIGVLGVGVYTLFPRQPAQKSIDTVLSNELFGWKFPVTKFPLTGTEQYRIAYSDIRDPGGIPQGLPVRLKIPAIGVDSAIEDALITPDGRMDVPAGSVNVAWFALGPHPGKEGSAVIGGHYGIRNGVPFVFYELDKLKIGDKVYIVDDKGDTLAFIVRDIKLFDRDADATTVFTSNDGLAHLNIITCEGIWNKVNDSYPERRVIFTDAIPFEGTVTVPKAPVPVAVQIPSLRIGARGTQVVAVQTALEQKGFLVMPRGVAKGYFGILTRAALIRYQRTVGLPQDGVIGPSTRAALFAAPPTVVARPTLPTTAIEAPAPTSTPSEPLRSATRVAIQHAKNLYATPVAGLITTLLLLSIVLMAYKIIRRK